MRKLLLALALASPLAGAWETSNMGDGLFIASEVSQEYRNNVVQLAFFPSRQCNPMLVFTTVLPDAYYETVSDTREIQTRVDRNTQSIGTVEHNVSKGDTGEYIESLSAVIKVSALSELYQGNKLIMAPNDTGTVNTTYYSLSGSKAAIGKALSGCMDYLEKGDEWGTQPAYSGEWEA